MLSQNVLVQYTYQETLIAREQHQPKVRKRMVFWRKMTLHISVIFCGVRVNLSRIFIIVVLREMYYENFYYNSRLTDE